MSIEAINPVFRPITEALATDQGAQLPMTATVPGVGHTENKSFGDFLSNAISEVDHAQKTSIDLSSKFAAGKNVDIHEVMIAGQEAGIALNMALQVRNKLVDSYQEIMRINV